MYIRFIPAAIAVLAAMTAGCGSGPALLATDDGRPGPQAGPTVAGTVYDHDPMFSVYEFQCTLSPYNCNSPDGSANAVNDLGLVTGYRKVIRRDLSVGPQAYRYSTVDKSVVWLPPLAGYQNCAGAAINSNGKIAGNCFAGTANAGFTWTQAGGLVALTGGTATWAHGISPDGAVVGAYRNSLNRVRAALWSTPASLIDLHPSGADSSRAVARNARGDIALNAWYPGGRSAGFRLVAGTATGPIALAPLIANGWTLARGMNSAGTIVGSSQVATVSPLGGLRWDGAVWAVGSAPVRVAGATLTTPRAISDKNRIVGQQGGAAFTVDGSGRWSDLNLPPGDAFGVNICGMIAARYDSPTLPTRAVTLIPRSCDP